MKLTMKPAVNLIFRGLVILALLGSATATAQDPDPDAPGLGAGERVDALVQRIQLEQSRLETLSARFSQRKESLLLLEPEVSGGRFWYQSPDRVRWEFEEPVNTVIVVRDDAMLTWYRDLGRAELVHVGKQADKILQYLGASHSLTSLQSYFDVKVGFPDDAEAPFSVSLDPRFERVKKRLAEMSIKLHRKLYVPVFLRYVEPDGDVTEMTFDELQVNQEIPADRFDLTLPEGVEVREIELSSKRSR